jgi:hypothetical protein
MHQIKIFKGIENDLATLEAEVNTWLVESEARVVSMFGNIAPQSESAEDEARGLSKSDFPPSDVLLVILFESLPH